MRILEGIVVSGGTNKTVVVEVTRRTPHPLYKKLIKKSKRIKADTGEMEVNLGNTVRIVEARPFSKDKYFKVTEIIGSRQIKNEKVYLKSEKVEVAEESLESAKKETVKKVIRRTKASKKMKGEEKKL